MGAGAAGGGGGGGERGAAFHSTIAAVPHTPNQGAADAAPCRSASTPYWRVSRAQRAPNSLYTAHRGRLIEARPACLLLCAVATAQLPRPASSWPCEKYTPWEAVAYIARPSHHSRIFKDFCNLRLTQGYICSSNGHRSGNVHTFVRSSIMQYTVIITAGSRRGHTGSHTRPPPPPPPPRGRPASCHTGTLAPSAMVWLKPR